MKITDITPETEGDYLCCLEEWSEDMKEAGTCKRRWYDKMKGNGLKVKFAVDDNDVIGGMIQYLPIEHSIFDGDSLYVVLCIWVHGHKKGRGDHRKKGMGKALLKAAEDDARRLGARGMVTWGLILPVFMRASWFRKQGYRVVDKTGIMRLMMKPFNENVTVPKFKKPVKRPEEGSGKVNITLFRNGWCQSVNITCERIKRAAAEFPDKTEIRELDTTDESIMKEWEIPDAAFVDNIEIRTGPPASYDKIRRKIEKRVKRAVKVTG